MFLCVLDHSTAIYEVSGRWRREVAAVRRIQVILTAFAIVVVTGIRCFFKLHDGLTQLL
jgi:hypothetical protein